MKTIQVTMLPDETYQGWELNINNDEYMLHFDSECEALSFIDQLCEEVTDCMLSFCTERFNLGNGNVLQRCYPLGRFGRPVRVSA